MSAHVYHPREGLPDAPVLFDACERCREHADRRGLDLDAEQFERAWRQMVKVERDDGSYRSDNEALLCRALYEQALILERFMGVNPWRWPPRQHMEFVEPDYPRQA